MHNKKQHADENEDIVFDDTVEEASTADAVAKLQKVKEELKACRAERQEFLDGWQRLKADVVNKNKDEQLRFDRAKERTIESVLESLLPALDSFDAAMQGQAWHNVNDTWRVGVEYIHTQLLEGLRAAGIERFGVAGDTYDVTLHEVASEQPGPMPGTILAVERAGYKIKDRVIRPARVVVAA
jgi:molecular chaperone GrpE